MLCGMSAVPTIADPEVAAVLAPDRRRVRRRWGLVAGAAVAVVAVSAVWCLAGTSPPTFETGTVVVDELVVTVEATGTLEAAESVQVGSEVSGRLVEVSVDYNDLVVAGQVLARIDPQQLEASADQARAQLLAAEAAMAEAAATTGEADAAEARAEREAKKGLLSVQELESRRASAARGRAAVRSAAANAIVARANVHAAEDQLAKAVVVSPIDGVVLDRHVSVGQTVTAGFETPVLFDLARDLSQMRLVVDIDEADVARVHEGQEATFTVDALPGQALPSWVQQVRYAPKTTDGVVTYEAVLTVDNADRSLRPGMTATADIVVAERPDAVLVPSEALLFDPDGSEPVDGPHVWSVDEGEPRPLPVEVGLSDGEWTEVLSELEPGTVVLVGTAQEGR